MPEHTLLIVDDEPSIRELVRIFLMRHHYNVLEAENATDAMKILDTQPVDLMILDLMLPDEYGIDFCKRVRERFSLPIIMLTAVQGDMNTVLGLEAGADDYIEKPFNVHVLLARIRTILKRQGGSTTPITIDPELPTLNDTQHYEKAFFGQWVYSKPDACITHHSGKHVYLTKNECQLLHLFIENQEAVLSRERIAEALNLDIDDIESRAIDVQISRLRNKLKDKSQSNLIKSIRNKGYLLAVPVRLQ